MNYRDLVMPETARCSRARELVHNVEGYLLDQSTGLDITGRNLQEWPTPLIAEVLEAHPRLGIATSSRR